MSAVSTAGVTAAYDGPDVLTDVDLDLDSGEMGAILGPSGSGKTTLLRVIAGLHRPRVGTVRVGDKLLSGPDTFVAPERRRVGLVPQAGALFPHLDVRQNVGFGLRRASLGRSAPSAGARDSRVDGLLALTGLADLHDRMPHQLSGGQQQRVALVRALAPEPRLVLLDEPFASLDASLRADLRDDVRRVLTSTGATALLVTHDQGEALSFADRLFVMHQGRVLQQGTPRDLYQAPVSTWVGRFLGDALVIDAVSDGRTASSPWGPVPHDRGASGAVDLLLRPEQLALSTGTGPSGLVREVRFLGHDALVDVELDVEWPDRARQNGVAGLMVKVRVGAGQVPELGSRVAVSVHGPVRAYPARGA